MKRFTLALVFLSVVLNALAFSTSNYVQDGLIACWDGIENAGKGVHDSEATVWTDIVGGKKFALTTGVTVNADRMTFAGNKDSYGVLSAEDTVSTFVAAKDGTLEIVYASNTGAGTQILLQSTASSGLAFGIFNAGTIILHTAKSGQPAARVLSFSSGSAINAVAVRYSSGIPDSAMVNGDNKPLSGSNYWGSPDTSTLIGKRNGVDSQGFSGSIYCIRLYSKKLSEEEIAANYEVDLKRFILQVDDSTLLVSSSVEAVGSPSPAHGPVYNLVEGENFLVTCGDPEVTMSNGSVYSCTGWKLYDEAGAVVSSGAETAFTYSHPAAYRKLEWQWEITSPPTRYVQDGLIARWDGIENVGAGVHENNLSAWKDLVAGYEFKLTGVAVDEKSMTFAGSDSSFGILSNVETASTFVKANSGTMEIVYRSRTGNDNQVIMQSTAASGMAFAIWKKTKILPYTSGSQAAQLSFSFASGTETNVVAVRYVSGAPIAALANGTALVPDETSSWASPGGETIIGNRSTKLSQYAFPGSIFAIRLYDRHLTDAEIMANLSIDRQRFFSVVDTSRLEVSSAQSGIGSPSPAYGYLTDLTAGTTKILSAGQTPWMDATDGTRYSCIGWKLYDKDGAVVDSGSGRSFSYTHPTPAAYRRLEWQWRDTSSLGFMLYVR